MKLLLDTHVFLWWIEGDDRLSAPAVSAIENPSNELYFSTASVWEIAIKVSLGRLKLQRPADEYVSRYAATYGITSLAIADAHAYKAAGLPKHHADPFDRMLVAQAQVEAMTLVTGDVSINRYDVQRLW